MKVHTVFLCRSLFYMAFVLFLLPSFSNAQWNAFNRPHPGVALVDSVNPGEHLPSRLHSTTQVFLGARIEPLVIRKGTGTFLLTVAVDPSVAGIQLHTSGSLVRTGNGPDYLRLYDDGTHGDAIAGDKMFSLDSLSPAPSILAADALPIGGMTLGIGDATIEYPDNTSADESITFYPHFQWIDPAQVPVVQVHSLATDVHASDYCMNIVVDPDPSVLNETAILQRYFLAGGEDKDFVFLETPFYSWGIAGYSVTVSNDVQNIGVGIFDYSSAYGSQGNLKSYIRTFSMSLNPVLLNHELLHHWAAFLDTRFGFGQVHWGAIERPTTGFGNYWGAYKRLESVAPGLFRGYLSDPNAYYNDLELYLMGLASDSEVVSPIRTIVNPVAGNSGTDPVTRETYREITGDELKEVNMQEIIAVHGPRTPDVGKAQKRFSSALIVAYDRQLTDVEFSYFDFLMRQYEQALPSYRTSFEKATRGRGSMSTRLSTPLPLPTRVQLSSPPDNANLGSDTVRLCWNASSPAVIQYWLEYATDSLFSRPTVDSSLTDTAHVILGVESGTIYWWKVKAGNSSGWGPFSEVHRFRAIFTGVKVDNAVPTNFALFQNYPNPFNPLTIIKYTIAGAGGSGLGARNTSLVVYDVLGREVAVLVNERKQPGHYEMIFDGSRLSSGVYFYRMEAGTFVSTRKLLLVR
jgi:hypothetical protein